MNRHDPANPPLWRSTADPADAPISTGQIILLPGRAVAGKDDTTIQFCPHGRNDLAPFTLAFPLDWDLDPFHDRNWCGQLHMWRMLDAYLLAFERSRDPAFLALPLAVMLDWHRYHLEEKRISRFAWKDMMVGLRAMKLAFVVSHWQAGAFEIAPSALAALAELVKAHLDFLLDEAHLSYSNHTIFDQHGLMALAQVVSVEEREPIEAFVARIFPALLRLQFDRRGMHLENSPGYQPLGIICLTQLQQSGWFARYGVDALKEKAVEIMTWLQLPDGRIAPVGDTDGAPQKINGTKPVFTGQRQVFNCSGYAVIRDDGGGRVERASYLFFMGAYNGPAHKHADDLSLLWFEGEDLLVDPGKYSYQRDPYRDYVISARAHNSVEIDAQDSGHEPKDPAAAYGSAIDAVAVHDWGYRISAAVRYPKLAVRHRRHCLFQPGAWLLLIDRLSGEVAHTFTQWSHFAPTIDAFAATDGGHVARLAGGRSLTVQSVTSQPGTSEWFRGATEPRLQGWVSQGYRQIVPSLALGIKQRGSEVLFATLFTLDDEGSTLALQPDQQIALAVCAHGAEERLEIGIDELSCRVMCCD